MLAQTTFILLFEASFDHSKMFSLNKMVPISLTRILTRALSLHLSRSYPFSSTTVCPDLILLLQRSCLTPCLYISPLISQHTVHLMEVKTLQPVILIFLWRERQIRHQPTLKLSSANAFSLHKAENLSGKG